MNIENTILQISFLLALDILFLRFQWLYFLKMIFMINDNECMRILNSDGTIYKKDDMRLIRNLLVTLATIEFESRENY